MVKQSGENNKIVKCLPKSWHNANKALSERVYPDSEFAIFCGKLYKSLIGIKKFYENDFNRDNICTIDEYIDYFNNQYSKFLNLSIDNKNEIEKYFNECYNKKINIEMRGRFEIFDKIRYRNPYIYSYNTRKDTNGFTDNGYKTINSIAKDMFLIEKLCSFTTRKFWKNELTRIEDLNVNSDFKILVKCVFPKPWRSDYGSKELKNYYDDRIYSSTSLIDEKHKENLFAVPSGEKFAILVMDCDVNSIVCASEKDSYSEEQINNKNLLQYKQEYSQVLLQHKTNVNSKNHKLFAEAVECETPKNILSNVVNYNEVNLKNPKPVGVICPNIQSIEFAKKQADKYCIPFFMFEYEKTL